MCFTVICFFELMLGVQCHTPFSHSNSLHLTSEVTGSLLCIIAGIFDESFMIGFTNATKEIASGTKSFHKCNKFGESVDLW